MPRFLGDIERDARFVKFQASTPLATTARSFTQAPYVKYPGVGTVQLDHAEFNVWESVTIGGNRYKAAGCVLAGPDELGGRDAVPYRVVGSAGCESANFLPVVFYAISPASPDGATAGKVVEYPRPLVTGATAGKTSEVTIDELLAVSPFGTISSVDYSARSITFGIMFLNVTSSSTSETVWCNMSVQRLVGPAPLLYDRRKR